MDDTGLTAEASPPQPAYSYLRTDAFRGGAFLLVGWLGFPLLSSTAFSPLDPVHRLLRWLLPAVFNPPRWAADLWFFPPVATWAVFVLGSLLGAWCSRRLRQGTWGRALAKGALLGVVGGGLVALALVLTLRFQDLIGLWVNRHNGGYASYRYSVLHTLPADLARHASWAAPVLVLSVLAWVWWVRTRPVVETVADQPERLRLGFGRDHLILLLSVSALFAVYALGVMLRNSGEVKQVWFVVLGAAGLPFLGPMLGPLVNPGGAGELPGTLLRFGLPVVAAAHLPFLSWNWTVSRRTATFVWSAYVTAILLWVLAGMIALAASLG